MFIEWIKYLYLWIFSLNTHQMCRSLYLTCKFRSVCVCILNFCCYLWKWLVIYTLCCVSLVFVHNLWLYVYVYIFINKPEYFSDVICYINTNKWHLVPSLLSLTFFTSSHFFFFLFFFSCPFFSFFNLSTFSFFNFFIFKIWLVLEYLIHK